MDDEDESELKHPAKMWPTRWIWHDRSQEPAIVQVVDILMDIRNLLTIIAAVLAMF